MLEDTYTLQEVIFCALSSIACFGLSDKEVEKYFTKESETQKTCSLAVLFGTFADKIIAEANVTKLANAETAMKSLLESSVTHQFSTTTYCRPFNLDQFYGGRIPTCNAIRDPPLWRVTFTTQKKLGLLKLIYLAWREYGP